jgi:hypothetical protein
MSSLTSRPEASDRRTGFLADARSRLLSVCLWASICALWICARPYRGVRHDAILYLGLVFNRLWPSTYGSDLFFHYGSQDRFSVFSILISPLVRAFGVTATEVTVLFLAQLVLLVGLARLLDQIGLRAWRWPALLVLACSPHIYGGLGDIGFAEPFLTARTLAEPLAVWAMLWLLQRRWIPAGIAALAGMAMHPIIVLPVLVVGWIDLGLQDRRWLWIALVVPVVVVLALAGVAPFDAALRRYDTAWWDVVHARNALVFVTQWVAADHQSTALDFLVLGVAWRLAPEPEQARLWLSTLLAAAGLMAFTILGADIAHGVLVTQMQQWRVMWWAHMMVLLATPWLVTTLWRSDRALKVAALAMAVSLLSIGANWSTGCVFVLAFALALAAHWRRVRISPSMFRIIAATFVLAATTISVVVFTSDLKALAEGTDRIADVAWYRVLFTIPATALLAGGGLLWLQKRLPLAAAAGIAVALLAFAGGGWDQRSEWSTYLEAEHPAPHPFRSVIADGSEVYWIDDVKAVWFGLRTHSFMSEYQAGGVLFNRDTAIEYQRRANAFGPLGAQKELCGIMATLNGPNAPIEPKCFPSPSAVQLICSLPDGPRYLVFKTALDRGVVAHWRFEAARASERVDYYLHDCNKIVEGRR